MISKPLPLIVKPKEPFKDDALKRQELCAKLTDEYIHKEISPYVLAIDADWGNGKTVFLDMWKAYLEAQGTRCVLYDAWKSDFYGDALATMIGEISAQFSESQPEEFKDAAGRLIKAMPLAGFKAAASAVGLGAVADAAANSVKQHDAIEDYLKYCKARDNFSDKLKSFAESEDTPLVFFIDELDRCRPDFALEVLEKTKHIFDVESVIFVVALNQTALAQTIEKTYGIENGRVYLQKFFDKVIPLKNNSSVVAETIRRSPFPDFMRENAKDYHEIITDLMFLLPQQSCRVQNLVIAEVASVMRDEKNIHYPHQLLFTFFSVIKLVNRGLYEEIIRSDDDLRNFPFEQTMSLIESAPTEESNLNDAKKLFHCLEICRAMATPNFTLGGEARNFLGLLPKPRDWRHILPNVVARLRESI